MHETAFAKLNLALNVRERLPDGYHRIETVFAFCEEGDRLTAAQGEGLTLEVTGPFGNDLTGGDDNLVLRAAAALRDRCNVDRGVALTLDKRLPVAAGIGGGSADAAATLRLLRRWWSLDVSETDLLAIAAALGADVPACLLSQPARGEGKGDQLASLDGHELAGVPVLLVNPRVKLPTKKVFEAWDGKDRGALGDWRDGRNDLEPAAIALVPEIAELLAALGGAEMARMSGSGATCFGLYATESARDSAASAIAAERPDWWVMATRLR